MPRVVLVGPMGAGKTTVGRLLASRWGVLARDTDADVEALEGRTISDIFVESGEAHFRELERKAVADALASHDGVLALGGGAVLDPGTRVRPVVDPPDAIFLLAQSDLGAPARCVVQQQLGRGVVAGQVR